MYAQAQQQQGESAGATAGGSSASGGAKTDEKVVDAEFTEVKSDKK